MPYSNAAPEQGVLQQFLRSSPDPAWIIDGHRFVDCNQIALETLGYASRDQFLNLHPSMLSPPTQADGEDSFSKAERMMLCANEKGLHRFEWIHTKADGTNFDAEVTLVSVETGNRQVLYCVWRDLTERKRAKAALLEGERQLRSLSTMSSDWFWQQDAQFQFTEFFGTFARDFTPPAGSIGKARWQLNIALTPAQWAAHRAILDAHLPFRDFEYPITDENGETRWFSINGDPRFDEAGQFSGYHGTGRNITEHKRAQMRLQLAANVFTHAREAIFITDASGSIIEVNDTFSQITGYSREETLGSNPRMLRSGHHPAVFFATMWQGLVDQGFWSGEIWNQNKSGEAFAAAMTISAVRDGNGQVQQYVALFSDVTALKAHQKELEHQAHYDTLTGLPNRLLLADRLKQAIAQCQRHDLSIAVVYLDLDNLKAVNDGFGHDAGDVVLVTVCRRLKEALREGDTLARLGGDEFVAVLGDLAQPQDSYPVIERLLSAAAREVALSRPSDTEEEPEPVMLKVSASIGVTFYPRDEVDADLLLRHADQAMYLAKQSGRNRYQLFDIAQDTAIRMRHESLQYIREALNRHEFVLFYQPKVNMRTGKVVGAEALIRWQHPERGLLPPAQFLPAIEGHPISVEVGEWVIKTALTQMSDWNAAGLKLPVSVNIGARQLQQDDFASRLSALLAAHPDVLPGSLQLEVLETSAMEDIAGVTAMMHACHDLGVSFALDDFGTGYSSLTYLRRLPAEVLKIDQSFIRDMTEDPDDLAIVKGVIELATIFYRQVIAEGVETQAHGDLLVGIGCEMAQGYGIARPMPAEDIPQWVKRWLAGAVWTA